MKMNWFPVALISMLLFSAVFILYRKIADLGVRSEVLFMYYFGISTIALLFYLLYSKIPLSVSKAAFTFIVIAAVLGVIGNVLLVNSLKLSPNPGYALAVIGFNTILVAIASVFVFKSEFTLVKGVGVILSVIGVILVGL